jgi:hypothetical protein
MTHDNGMPPEAAIDGQAEEILDEAEPGGEPNGTRAALVAAGKAPGLLVAGGPREFLAKAQEVAEALVDVVRKQKLYVEIGGNEHPQVEAWQALGALLGPFSDHGGVFPHTIWARPQLDPATRQASLTRYTVKERRTKGKGKDREVIEREYEVEGYDYEARVEARTASGLAVGTAEASCSRKEARWAQQDDYAVRSMAQTRATSKALKAATAWLMVLAGYKPTPAEEMPDDEGQERTPAWAQPADGELLDQARAAVRELGGPHATALARKITAACGETLPRGLARALVHIATARRAQNGERDREQDPGQAAGERPATGPGGRPEGDQGETVELTQLLELARGGGYKQATVRALCELLFDKPGLEALEGLEPRQLRELLGTARAGGTGDEQLHRTTVAASEQADRERARARLRDWLVERAEGPAAEAA